MLSWFRRWRAQRASADQGEPADDNEEAAGERAGDEDTGDEGDDGADEDTGDEGGDAPVEAELTDELDLHTFLPKECGDVVEEYVRAAQEAGFSTVRIIHGKGKGTLRRIVHAALARHPAVRSFQLAAAHRGSWGATVVELEPKPPG